MEQKRIDAEIVLSAEELQRRAHHHAVGTEIMKASENEPEPSERVKAARAINVAAQALESASARHMQARLGLTEIENKLNTAKQKWSRLRGEMAKAKPADLEKVAAEFDDTEKEIRSLDRDLQRARSEQGTADRAKNDAEVALKNARFHFDKLVPEI